MKHSMFVINIYKIVVAIQFFKKVTKCELLSFLFNHRIKPKVISNILKRTRPPPEFLNSFLFCLFIKNNEKKKFAENDR